MGREPGTSCYQSGSPLLSHTRAPRCALGPLPVVGPIPSPTPRALADTYRPWRCPSTGPASRASGPAPTWRRRSGRTGGGGAQTGPFGRGMRGRGGGGAMLSWWPLQPPPRGVRKESWRGRGRVRAALLTTTCTWKTAAPERDPRALTLRPVPGTDATRAKQALASNTATRQKPSNPPSKL